ncbi:serine/threonine protein kinase [Geomesophilobacter sediminis]|uniref:Stress response kinase A n=1 Tax=Geomesophilobacter sediminis TaxID=2798584 RepID=A0A8J7JE29_9BACT|nr:serine/threonine protein kinase [Geomesophilobacter sediminis]MBJ6725648.1 serine/threonine protein kinase [Geomesophilobacter sediminis]
MADSQHPFQILTPNFIMDAVESQGFRCDCRTLALNSYENRVYQVGIEEGNPLIAKFYRPERWSEEQIREEHELCLELAERELPVVAPWRNPAGETLFGYEGLLFALYPRQGGHAPEFDNLDNLLILGRMLGRMHSVGALAPFRHRPVLDTETFGTESVALIAESFIPAEYRESYLAVTEQLLSGIEAAFAEVSTVRRLRVHGDCHAGNILWRDGAPHFVDFDDARTAPAVQDLWMMLSGDRQRQTQQLDSLIEGYREFNDFDPRELRLVEPLRALRMLHYNAWLARRWEDPSFPLAFPWFNTLRYWGEHILQLREQVAALSEEPLQLL